METTSIILTVLVIISIFVICLIVKRASDFRRCHGYNRILKREYKNKKMKNE